MRKCKILYFATEDWFFCSHFLDRAVAALSAGYKVTVVTRVRKHGGLIKSLGLKLVPIDLDRRSANPWLEVKLIRKLVRVYRTERPDIVHHVALKPIIYGTLAARAAGIRNIINAPVGMGFALSSDSWRARLVGPLIMFAFKILMNPRGSLVIVENPDDRALLIGRGIADPGRIRLIRGAGVDLDRFSASPERAGVPLVVLPARMLWDKGVREFVDAARRLRAVGANARFALVGGADGGSPATISDEQMRGWVEGGDVEWWGYREDMAEVLRSAHVVCLPSYREGLPKVLIEAAASARPIVTTEVPGCREVVKHRENGLLVPPRDSAALAHALRILIENPDLRRRMGARGRQIAEEEFAIARVVAETQVVYRELLAQ